MRVGMLCIYVHTLNIAIANTQASPLVTAGPKYRLENRIHGNNL